nr:hypothetical protein CFP56_06014 [Quercus suber]
MGHVFELSRQLATRISVRKSTLSLVGDIPPSATVSTLVDHNLCDSISWPETLDEIYTVKSGYKLILEEDNKDIADVATAEVMKGVWSRIWKLKVPNCVRNLLWHAGNDSLPTKANLLKRKFLDDLSPLQT